MRECDEPSKRIEYRPALVNNVPNSGTEEVRYWQSLSELGYHSAIDYTGHGELTVDPDNPVGGEMGLWGEWQPWITHYPQWTAEHKLNGVSWVYVELTQPDYGQDLQKRLFTKLPNLEFLVDGVKITYPHPAPPEDSPPGLMKTESSENAAAVRYWWETARRGRDAAEINVEEFRDAYNACEQMVDVSAGLPASHAEFSSFANAKRYTINGVISAGDDVSSVEDQMDAAWAGEVIEVGGKLRFRPGVMRPTTAELNLDHRLADKDIIEPPSVRPWAALQQRVNAIDAEIAQSAAHEWTRLSLPKYRDQAAFERDGQERGGSIKLAYVTNPIAAGRLQAVNLRRARESLRMEVAVTPGENFERLSLIPTDVVAVTSSEYGFANKRMEIERVAVREDWSVALTLREVLDGTYDNTLVLPKLKPRAISLPDERTVPDVEGLAAGRLGRQPLPLPERGGRQDLSGSRPALEPARLRGQMGGGRTYRERRCHAARGADEPGGFQRP